MITAADCVDKRQGNADQFKQLVEKPCTNHGFPAKHMLKAPKDHGAPPKGGSGFPDSDGCLMFFGGPVDDCTKRQHKVRLWEICAAGNAIPKFPIEHTDHLRSG
jgi:hypothetical protein